MIDPNLLLVAFGGMMVGAAALYKVPHSECAQCPHCQEHIVLREKKKHDSWHNYFNVERPSKDCMRCKEWPHKE
jgi:hypothetical protein